MRARNWVALGLLTVAPACDRGRAANGPDSAQKPASSRPDSTRGSAITTALAGTPRPSSDESSESGVQPQSLPAEVARACDEVQAMVQASIGAAPRREDGVFDDSMRRGRVLGCRLSADEIISATAQTKEGQSIESRMNAAGWAQDLRYSADGPGSSSIGMRRRDLLCYVSSSVDVADDDDTTSTSKATPDSAHDVIECGRDVSSNTSDEVPDTLWSIARERGLDSLYAFDFRLQTPPYLSADFDGDGVPDAAVLIGERSSGKLGVALVLRGSRQVVIVGAGKPLDGWGDDFSGIKEWDTFRRGSMRVVAKDYPSEALTADALWMSRRDSTSGFIVRSGDGYRWIAPLKR